ncbi:hypothetical protein SDJN02_08251, partial [Cucurbita argyrosperma subsp. argyrosperma]
MEFVDQKDIRRIEYKSIITRLASIAYNPIPPHRTKHIEADKQNINVLTKELPKKQYDKLRDKLTMEDIKYITNVYQHYLCIIDEVHDIPFLDHSIDK